MVGSVDAKASFLQDIAATAEEAAVAGDHHDEQNCADRHVRGRAPSVVRAVGHAESEPILPRRRRGRSTTAYFSWSVFVASILPRVAVMSCF